MPRVEVKVFPPEFRWGEAPPSNLIGDIWFLRGLGANDSVQFNDTTQRYISLGVPMETTGNATPEAATFRCTKLITLHSLAILFDSAFGVGQTASFRFYVDGTNNGIELDCVEGDSKKLATGLITVPRGAMVCLECTEQTGGVPDIQSVSLAYRTVRGNDVSV